MATPTTIKDMGDFIATFKALLIGDENYLAQRRLFVHKDVSDIDLIKFIAKAIKTKATKVVENEIVLMNENCICFMQDNKYYLLPAKVISMSINDSENRVNVLCDYGDKPVKLDDFVEIGGKNNEQEKVSKEN